MKCDKYNGMHLEIKFPIFIFYF